MTRGLFKHFALGISRCRNNLQGDLSIWQCWLHLFHKASNHKWMTEASMCAPTSTVLTCPGSKRSWWSVRNEERWGDENAYLTSQDLSKPNPQLKVHNIRVFWRHFFRHFLTSLHFHRITCIWPHIPGCWGVFFTHFRTPKTCKICVKKSRVTELV